MEFAGFDESIRPERLRLLTAATQEYLRDIQLDESWPEKWFGWRPMTYDSTPVIGRCPGFDNVYLATGHNMLGLSMAPATGKLLAELVAGQETHIDALPYRVDRF
jgi:D-amino-acid dehydrogenase